MRCFYTTPPSILPEQLGSRRVSRQSGSPSELSGMLSRILGGIHWRAALVGNSAGSTGDTRRDPLAWGTQRDTRRDPLPGWFGGMLGRSGRILSTSELLWRDTRRDPLASSSGGILGARWPVAGYSAGSTGEPLWRDTRRDPLARLWRDTWQDPLASRSGGILGGIHCPLASRSGGILGGIQWIPYPARVARQWVPPSILLSIPEQWIPPSIPLSIPCRWILACIRPVSRQSSSPAWCCLMFRPADSWVHISCWCLRVLSVP